MAKLIEKKINGHWFSAYTTGGTCKFSLKDDRSKWSMTGAQPRDPSCKKALSAMRTVVKMRKNRTR